MEEVVLDRFSFAKPSPLLLIGATGSGKSYFILKMIKERQKLFKTPVKRVVYCYEVYQEIFDAMKKDVIFVKGLVSEKTITSWNNEHTILVIDDLQYGSFDRAAEILIVKLFAVLSHHRNITVIFVSHNIFSPVKYFRNLSLNAHYIILFANKRDNGQVCDRSRLQPPGPPLPAGSGLILRPTARRRARNP